LKAGEFAPKILFPLGLRLLSSTSWWNFVMDRKRRVWLGGYVRNGKKGPTYVIERWVRGEHFHVSTRCRTERAALKQLERFEADPYGYTPLPEDSRVVITLELCAEFRDFMVKRKRNSPEWIETVMRFLGDWEEDLGGKDLRFLNLQRDLKPPLETRKSRKHRIEAIKSFCSWLRTEKGLLRKAEDATLDLKVPQSPPAKHKRRRAQSREHVLAILPQLPDVTRDVLTLQIGTAWHISEVRRFASGGEIVEGTAPLLAVLVVKHKGGDLVRTPIKTPEHLEAARRLRARGAIPIKETLAQHMRDACDRIRAQQRRDGVPEEKLMPHFRLGDMRATVLTWAVEMGATPQEASEFAHHRSLNTTRRMYLDLAVPTVSVPVLRLVKGV
jgi:hypothetical protein